jgi:hypothetical protein
MDCCHRYLLDIEHPVSPCAFRDTALLSPMRRACLIRYRAWRSTEGHAACRVVHGSLYVVVIFVYMYATSIWPTVRNGETLNSCTRRSDGEQLS